ncbi:MAG: DNA internalization-related competence protein ComEC/Rec2 [Oscillospiraceae bacterium]|nr:DNA internalization-related competence protein ComEC/Rec2 [Oscillospiraceae bacterium]
MRGAIIQLCKDTASYFARRRLCLGTLSFAAGTALGVDARYSPPLWLVSVGSFGFVTLLRGRKIARFFVLIGLFGLGLAWCSLRTTVPPDFPGAGTYLVRARVRTPVVIGGDGASRFDISNITLVRDGETLALAGSAYAWVDSASAAYLEPGDWIELTGSIRLPDSARNPGGFDARRWALTRGDYYTLFADKSVTLIRSESFSLTRTIRRAQMSLAARIDGLFGEDAPLLRAIVLGETSLLPTDWRESFGRVGIVHLLSVSGLHIGFVYLVIKRLLDLLDRSGRIGLSPLAWVIVLAVALIPYTIMVGLSPSALRASLMLLGYRFATVVARRADHMTCLSMAAALMLIASPADVASISFQLSFSAMAGLILLTNPLKRLFDNAAKHVPLIIRSTLTMTIAAQAGLFVPSIQLTGFYPLLSPIANCIAIPLSSAIFPLSIPVLIIDAIYHPLAAMLAWPERLLLRLLRVIADAGASLGWLLRIPSLLPAVLIAGVFISLFIWSDAIRLRGRIRAVLSGSLAVAGFMVMIIYRAPIRYVQLDVGQALSGVLHSGSTTIVVDTGADGDELLDYLTATGDDIDALFITHGHIDHFGGLSSLLNDPLIKIKRIYVSDAEGGNVDPGYADALDEARAKGIPVTPLSRGDTLDIPPGISIEVLWPPSGYVNADANETSLVMRASVGGHTILFTGDVGEMEPLRNTSAELLVAAHHGSQYSTSAAFLEYMSPSLALISCGAGNRYLPHPDMLARLDEARVTYRRTDERGALTVYLDGEALRVRGFVN